MSDRTVRPLHILAVSALGYLSSLALAVLVVAVPGLTEALRADSDQLLTPFLALDVLRQVGLSFLALLRLRAIGSLTTRFSAVIHAVLYGAGTAAIAVALQLLLLRGTGWSAAASAAGLVVGSLIAVLFVRPRAV